MTDVLAHLFAQGRGEGADMATLRAIAEKRGSWGRAGRWRGWAFPMRRRRRTWRSCANCSARWRDAKRSVWKALIGWAARMMLALVLVGIAVRLGFAGYVK